MTIDLDRLVGRQIRITDTAGTNQNPDGVDNITVDSTDKTSQLIMGHSGNTTYVIDYATLTAARSYIRVFGSPLL